jgi:hypothetical protein
MRRILTAAGLTLASVALVASAGSPVSAAPAADFNHVTIGGSVRIVDDEVFGSPDDIETYEITEKAVRLVSGSPARTTSWRQCHGGEVRVELDVTTTPTANRAGSVDVVATSRLFEGRSCDTDDLQDTSTVRFTLTPNSSKGQTVELGMPRSDRADLRFTVKNFFNWEG